MALSYNEAVDTILSTLKTKWDSDTPALNGGQAPHLVYQFIESDLKPHPRDSGKAWARVTVRHNEGGKASLSNSDGQARYRRIGLAWVQVFVPAKSGSSWTLASSLAGVAAAAYEGKRGIAGPVVFTKVTLEDKPKEGAWVRVDVKARFYWDEIR